MARRIEIELTSTRPDGSWSWRAAGARQPRGVLDGQLLHEGAKPGDVLRVDAEFEIDGIVITHVLPPKDKKREEPQRIEVIGPSRADTPGVTTQLVGRGRGDRRDRPDRPDRDSRPRRQGPPGERGGRPAGGRDGGRPPVARDGEGRPPRREGDERRQEGQRAGSRPAERRGPRPEGEAPAARGPRPQPSGPRREGAGRAPDGGRARARRLSPGHAHRQEVMASLPPEEQAVAEQVLRGGIPAVRTAIHLEREKATAEGRPVPDAEQLLALAERLLPRLKAAEWHDRAEAAVKAGTDLTLRDLRSVVAGADVARDDETRQLATELRATLQARVDALRSEWLGDLTRHLDEGRIVRALQLAGRPPDTGTKLPADLAERASQAASAALSPDTAPERWMALMEAVASSPVRRSVVPAGLPAEPGPDLLRAAHQQSGRIPALATMLGVSIPPPPGPRLGSAPRRPPARPGGPGPGGSGRPRRPAGPPPAPQAGPGASSATETTNTETPATETPATETPATEAPATGTTGTGTPATATVDPAPAPAPEPAPATDQQVVAPAPQQQDQAPAADQQASAPAADLGFPVAGADPAAEPDGSVAGALPAEEAEGGSATVPEPPVDGAEAAPQAPDPALRSGQGDEPGEGHPAAEEDAGAPSAGHSSVAG